MIGRIVEIAQEPAKKNPGQLALFRGDPMRFTSCCNKKNALFPGR